VTPEMPQDPDSAPPPSPFERPVPVPAPLPGPALAPVSGRRGPGRIAVVMVALLAAAGGVIGGLLAADVVVRPDALRVPATVDAERNTELVALLVDVTRTEGVMLAFNEVIGERLQGVEDEATARAVISRAAAEGVGGLVALRPVIVAREGGRTGEIRDVYLPHLDSWIDYLAAVADEPGLLFASDEQQPYILLINVTAEAFRDALEDLLADAPTPAVAELAERILDDGFRSEGPPPSV
jgi:hypothetical protein